MANCSRLGSGFKFRDELIAQGERPPQNGIEFYILHEPLNTKVEQCLYFAASVFWRASAHVWAIAGQELKQTCLDPYNSEFRDYLLGRGAFPEKAALVLSVSSEEVPDNVFVPPTMHEHNGCIRHKFYIPGLLFILFVGEGLSPMSRELSLAGQPRSVMLAPTRRDDWFWSHIEMAAQVAVKGRKRGPI